jgi:hypothetical protein
MEYNRLYRRRGQRGGADEYISYKFPINPTDNTKFKVEYNGSETTITNDDFNDNSNSYITKIKKDIPTLNSVDTETGELIVPGSIISVPSSSTQLHSNVDTQLDLQSSSELSDQSGSSLDLQSGSELSAQSNATSGSLSSVQSDIQSGSELSSQEKTDNSNGGTRRRRAYRRNRTRAYQRAGGRRRTRARKAHRRGRGRRTHYRY